MTDTEFNQYCGMGSQSGAMKCASLDALNEHNDSPQLENKKGVICREYYWHKVERYGLDQFHNPRHEIAITPVP
jgi:hypothetical protein